MAYFRLEPFGFELNNMQVARLMTMIAEVNRNPKERKQAFRVEDFLLDLGSEDQGQDWEDQLKLIEQYNQAFGGEDMRSQNGDNQ